MAFDFASIVPSMVSGGAEIMGGLFESSSNRSSAKSQMAFQKDMSDTSYQRAVKDLEAAGLSPMLAYSQGGASSPSGASWSTENPVKGAVHSAVQASVANAQLDNIQADTQSKKADVANKVVQNRLLASELPDAEFKATMDKHWLGKAGKVIDRAVGSILPIGLGASAAKGIWNLFSDPTNTMHSAAQRQFKKIMKGKN